MMLWTNKDFLFFKCVKYCRKLGNGSAYYENLKGAGAAPTTKRGLAGRRMVLLLDIFRDGKEIFLAAFFVFARNWPPYFYSSLSGRHPSEQAEIAVFPKQSSFVEEL